MPRAGRSVLAVLLSFQAIFVHGANWAQLAGEREQNTAAPYIPDRWRRNEKTSVRPMWSARWGHAVVVLNQAVVRSYLTEEENSARAKDARPLLLLLGGDDGLPKSVKNEEIEQNIGIGAGKLRNDVWVGELSHGSLASWHVDDGYFDGGGAFNQDLIRSEMRWSMITPGRVAPPSWPSKVGDITPLSHDEWIACQDSIKEDLIDPTICNDPPTYCRNDILLPGCQPQAVWKHDNMWSPRRGHGATVANNKIFVIGGSSREQARIDDSRLVGGIDGQRRIETARDYLTMREDLALKNDVWVSEDGSGSSWTLVNPGCRDPQEEVLMQNEVWSRDLSDPSLPKIVGSIGSKCYRSSDCYGIAECKALGNTHEKVCVCPMFGPREHHAVAIQHRFKTNEDKSTYAEDVIYVVGGFTSVKQAFCSNRSCGPADGYRLAIDDAWMSSDGRNWIQFKPAFSKRPPFIGRGGHTALVVRPSFQSQANNNTDVESKDRLIILGGETLNPNDLNTTHLNDVWEVTLPSEPCCIPNEGCNIGSKHHDPNCLPKMMDWRVLTEKAEWPERAFHTSVYEPPSSNNQFKHHIYLMGGRNSTNALSDVWTWCLDSKERWSCDFCSPNNRDLALRVETAEAVQRIDYDAYLSVDSPLSALKKFNLPALDNGGNLAKPTPRSSSPFMSDADFSTIASVGVNTIRDLASADLYHILKLRGFDYPGKYTREVQQICHLRAVAIAFVDKCRTRASDSQKMPSNRIAPQTLREVPSLICGRGGDTKPCEASDWDGCTPIPGLTEVDVHGLGDVVVPQYEHNVSRIVEELTCRQVPGSRYSGASAYIDNKVVVLGGMGSNGTNLYRDAWARDDILPQAFITLKPQSRTPQSDFFFDSSEAGAIFEYKITRDDEDVTSWRVTTKSIGVDISWLDDKKGGPGKGWYQLFVRSVDPSGNRDDLFSTETNVHRWYYVPPVPWGFVSGCIITFLASLLVGYYEYRRRKRKAILERFALRRMRRKFRLKAEGNGEEEAQHGFNPAYRQNLEIIDQFSNSRSSTRKSRRSSSRHQDSDHERSRRSRRHRSHSRPRSKSNSRSGDAQRSSGVRRRRRKVISGEDEARRRRRRDKEKNRRQNLRSSDYGRFNPPGTL